MRERMKQRIERVKAEFGLLDHEVALDRIPKGAVWEELPGGKLRRFKGGMVGVILAPELMRQKIIKIPHSKDELNLEELRHEFCHYTHPDWSEQQVRAATQRQTRVLLAS